MFSETKNPEPTRYLSPFKGNMNTLKRLLECNSIDVRRKDRKGLSSLLHAAVGNGTPHTEEFEFLYNQQWQPYGNEEKIDGLELLGSTYVLQKKYAEGFKCWKKTFELRQNPRSSLPQERRPCISNVKPEWTTLEDIVQMEQDFRSAGDLDNILHQALLVRLRLCKFQCWKDVRLAYFDLTNKLIPSTAIIKRIALLVKWDEFTSLNVAPSSKIPCQPPSFLLRALFHIDHYFSDNKKGMEVSWEDILVVLQWAASGVEKFISDEETTAFIDSIDSNKKLEMLSYLRSVVCGLLRICKSTVKDENLESELRKFLQ